MSDRTPRVLAIDDDQTWLDQVPLILDGEAEVTCANTVDQAILAVQSTYFDVVLLDLNFDGDDRTGLDVYRAIAAADHSADVIVISGETDPRRLIEIVNAGVSQFIPKPATTTAVRCAVRSILQRRETRFRALDLACGGRAGSNSPHLVGSSVAMGRLREEVSLAVSSGARDILLTGETGTGKEVVARAIASLADTAQRLLPIHCGAISDGIAESELFGHVKGAFTGADRDRASAFEAAGGGYIFLDEIAEMPLNQQAKLLRVLQERRVRRVGSNDERPASFRCISATNVDLKRAIEERRFREDLYYRVAKFQIVIPPLRDRVDDIPELVQYFINVSRPSGKVEIKDQAIALLQRYAWPGNVRQLQSTVEMMLSRLGHGTEIREKEVLFAVPELAKNGTVLKAQPFLGGRQGAALLTSERIRFQRAISEAQGDRTEAARLLGLARTTFFRRAKELGLVTPRK